MTDGNAELRAEFIADVERLRKRRGWSVEELANRAQLDLEELERILGGTSKLPLDTIVMLAKGLEVSPGKLIDGLAVDRERD